MYDENKVFTDVAHRYGTPLYAYCEKIIKQRYSALKEALSPVKPLICFAMKANSTLGILKVFKYLGAGFDIVSEGELRRVLEIGGDPQKVAFSGVGKSVDEIEFALASKIRFLNVESIAELRVIEEVAHRLNVQAPVCFRVNPDVTAKTHKHLTTGTKTSKFGIPIEEIFQAWDEFKNSKSLLFHGIDCHIGSQITEVTPLESAYKEILRLASLLKEKGMPIRSIDLGGGFGISYSGHYSPLDMNALSKVVRQVFSGAPYEFVFEPGRYLIAEAGTLLTKVLYLKENNQKRFAIVDAGMNDLVRPAMYDSFHKIDVVSRNAGTPKIEIDVVGPVCESGCFFAHGREMPPLEQEDILAIRDAGAYGSVMGSNYNTRRLPAEVLIDETGASKLIRKREEYPELWRNEILD